MGRHKNKNDNNNCQHQGFNHLHYLEDSRFKLVLPSKYMHTFITLEESHHSFSVKLNHITCIFLTYTAQLFNFKPNINIFKLDFFF